jgi:hypothetical protein
MNRVALRILKTVARRGEVPLSAAIRIPTSRRNSHLDQYPLALLLEDGYLGVTINYTPPTGAEQMREFALAKTLHMFTLPKGADGIVEYSGIKSSGSMDPEKQSVFLRAKGALYLDERAQKLWDRIWSFVLGFSVGILTAIATAWAKGHLKLP